jgi:SAM-dependent methyltransferase
MTFDEMYRDGHPPWDIGRPQSEVLHLLEEGVVMAPVLDIGCGTGETALACAARGLAVRGIDGSPTAVERAREKAKARGIDVRFDVGDALSLGGLGETFRTVLDCGLFHVFDDADRVRYASSLFEAIRPRGSAFVLAFSDAEPNWGGPRRVRAEEFEAAFGERFEVVEVRRAGFETTDPAQLVQAWRVRLDRRARLFRDANPAAPVPRTPPGA